MKVLVTGSDGFIAKNLIVRLRELEGFEVYPFSRQSPPQAMSRMVADAEAVVHLAGVNRPQSIDEFETGNANLTRTLCETIEACGRALPVIFASSTQAAVDNPYGASKRRAEEQLRAYATRNGANVYVYRLPNVFGKWCKPNYNSAIATFCHNIARGQPININDGDAPLTLVYIDDVVDEFIHVLRGGGASGGARCCVVNQYQTTVGELARQLESFRDGRTSLTSERVGSGLARALYATYTSYLPPDAFAYKVPRHDDARGGFVEILKTRDSGQFSYFTAHPGVTRGGHYHHSKVEKFLVLKGEALFRFRHIVSDEVLEIRVSGQEPHIVESIPGWAHDITNVSEVEMIVMLWANEVFDHARPDTIASKL